MIHYAAAQRASNGRWDYTANGRAPVGYCAGVFATVWPQHPDQTYGFLGLEDYNRYRAEAAPFAAHYHADGHATKEEAEACYKRYLLDQRLHVHNDDLHDTQQSRCEVCKSWTSGYVMVGGYRLHALCRDHRTREVLEQLVEVTESWES